ncbi:hypothetical protein FOV70_03215 [Escherichia coli]|nr:hypothetical protein FOV70_03215 [Escherichia coli]
MIRFVTRNNCGFIKAPEIELSEQDDSQRVSFRGFMTETPVTGAHRAKNVSVSVIKKASWVNPHEA